MIAAARHPAGSTLLRRHELWLVCAWAAIGLLFARDLSTMIGIWWSSSTFNHCLLIPPIIVWLVAQRWQELRKIQPRGWLPGLVLVGIGAAAWLLGQAAGVALARHLGVIVLLQGSVLAIMGPEFARGIAFPLAYMLFLVPAGEELVPPLQTLTARMCMVLLALVGVPAHIEGVFITIPNGWFEVAEACSGVKFLIAMAALGVLTAHLCFTSWPRRVIFVVASLIIPVLANGVRAWGTIYVAHRTNAHFAAGFDHVFYGWIFFGVVIALLIGVSWRWFDRAPDDIGIDALALRAPAGARDRLQPVAFGIFLIILSTACWLGIKGGSPASVPDDAVLPRIAGWRQTAMPTDWRPNFTGADHLLLSRYTNRDGQAVDLAIAVFADQSEGHELVGYGQGAVAPESRWAWTDDQPSPGDRHAFRLTGPGGVVRDVVTFYRVGNIMTGSDVRVKLETLRVRLLGGPRRAVAIIASAPRAMPNQSAAPAIDAVLAQFGPIDRLADRMAGEAR